MLYNIVIGDDNCIGKVWEINKDTYGNEFLSNSRLRQKIRLPKGASSSIDLNDTIRSSTGIGKFNKTKVKDDDISDVIDYYNIPQKLFISSNKNMNLVYLYYSKEKDTQTIPIHNEVCFITINNNIYKLLKYNVNDNARIMQTYRKKEAYQGNVISFSKGPKDIQLLELDVYNKISGRYENICVRYFNESDTIEVIHNNVSKDQLASLKLTNDKIGNNMKHFKVTIPFDTLLTRVFIISDEFADDIALQDTLRSYIGNPIMIYLDKDILATNDYSEYEEEYVNSVNMAIKEYIIDAKVRAVTLIGVNISKTFTKSNNILYVFDLSWPGMTQSCIRSN